MSPLEKALQDVASMPGDPAPANDAVAQIDQQTIAARLKQHRGLLEKLHSGEDQDE